MKVFARDAVASVSKSKDVELNGQPLRSLLQTLRSNSLRSELLVASDTHCSCSSAARRRGRRGPVQASVELERLGAFGNERIFGLFQAEGKLVRDAFRWERQYLGIGLCVCPLLLPFAPCFVSDLVYQERFNCACYYVVTNLGLYMIAEESRVPDSKRLCCNCFVIDSASVFMKWNDVSKISITDNGAVQITGCVYQDRKKEKVEWWWFVQDKISLYGLLQRRGMMPSSESVLQSVTEDYHQTGSAPPVADIVRVSSFGSTNMQTTTQAPRRIFVTLVGDPACTESFLLPHEASWDQFCGLVNEALGITDAQSRAMLLRVRNSIVALESCDDLKTNDFIQVTAPIKTDQDTGTLRAT